MMLAVLEDACSPNVECLCSQFFVAFLEEDDRKPIGICCRVKLSSFMASMMSASLNSISVM